MRFRERMVNALSFKPVDRIPLVEWPIREATLRAWALQGYPEGVDEKAFFGLDPGEAALPVDLGMRPPFAEEVLEETREYRIWRDSLGAVRKDFRENRTPGFVTRSWLEFPVKDRAGFRRMTERFDPRDPGRYPAAWAGVARELAESAAPVHLSIPFLFWTCRDWMGLEGLCTAFYDQPDLVEEMFAFVTDFTLETLARGLGDAAPDLVELKEDMAYKGASMISPAMFRAFMLPHYRRLVDFLKARGARVVFVDCDGDPTALIPLWIEAGVDGMSPCEAAAGVDPVAVRRRFPRFAMLGGIDKRVLSRDRAAVRAEVAAKVPPLLEAGGYVPHVDHAVPPDATLENYIYCRRLIEAAAEGKPV
jgi:hypothetical protein